MAKHLIVWLLALLLLILAGERQAAAAATDGLTPVVLGSEATFPNRLQGYRTLNDPGGKLSLDDVRRLPHTAFSTTLGYGVAGAAGEAIWFVLPIRSGPANVDLWALASLLSFQHTAVDVFVDHRDGQVDHRVSGDALRLTARSLSARALGVAFNLAPGAEADLYIRVLSRTGVRFDFVLQPEGSFWQAYANESLFLGLFVGTLLLATLGSLIFGWALPDASVAYYGLLCVAVLVETYFYYGFSSGGSPWSSSALVVLERFASCAGVIFTVQFARAFLQTRLTSPFFDRALRTILWVVGLSVLLELAPPTEAASHHVFYFTMQSVVLMDLALGIWAVWRRQPFGLAFLASRLAMDAGLMIWLLAQYGFMAHGYHTLYATAIGQLGEILILGIVLLARAHDVERRRVVTEMKANEADRLAVLLRVMSHDLANAVQSIYISATLGLKHPERAPHYLDLIQSGIAIQRDLIEHVRTTLKMFDLDMGRLDSADLGVVVSDVQKIFAPIANAKGVHLRIDHASCAGVDVLGDRTILTTSVLGNVVANAIKFSDAGGTVAVQIAHQDRAVQVSISDQGIGIPPAVLAQLFDASIARTRIGTSGELGSGYGMPLVRTYVESFGGKIEVTSQAKTESPNNHGTTVTIVLKADHQASGPRAAKLAGWHRNQYWPAGQ